MTEPFDLDAWNANLDAALARLAEIDRDEAELHRQFIADLDQILRRNTHATNP